MMVKKSIMVFTLLFIVINFLPAYGETDWEWNKIGLNLCKEGRFTEALYCYNRAIRLNPAYEDAWLNKGDVLVSSGVYSKALSAYDGVL